MIVGNPDQRAQIGFGFGSHGDEVGAAMADLHDGRADAVPVEHFRLGLEQDRFRQSGGAGTEIEGARHGLPANDEALVCRSAAGLVRYRFASLHWFQT